MAYSLTNTSERYYRPKTGVPSFTVENIEDELHNKARALYSSQSSIYADLCIDWQKQYGAHDWNAYVGARFTDDTYSLSFQQGYDTGNDKIPNISGGSKYKEVDGNDDQWRSFTYYGHVA